MEKIYQFLKVLIALLLICVVAAGVWAITTNPRPQEEQTFPEEIPAPEESTENPNLAPDFTVFDIDGNAYKLSDFRGKPVILNFWASWCGPCKMEMPDIETAYQQYVEQIHFLLVNLADGYRETVEKGAAYVAEEGYTFPVYFDTDMEGAANYGVTGIPVTYFIDAEGNFVAYYQRAMTAQILQQGIDMLLG